PFQVLQPLLIVPLEVDGLCALLDQSAIGPPALHAACRFSTAPPSPPPPRYSAVHQFSPRPSLGPIRRRVTIGVSPVIGSAAAFPFPPSPPTFFSPPQCARPRATILPLFSRFARCGFRMFLTPCPATD